MPAILRRLSNLVINYISPDLDNPKILYTSFRSVPGCQTCVCKRGISF